MSIIYNDSQEKSELQRKIMAELREKQNQKPLIEDHPKLTSFDDTADAEYSNEIHLSKSTIWVLVLLGMVILAVVLFVLAH